MKRKFLLLICVSLLFAGGCQKTIQKESETTSPKTTNAHTFAVQDIAYLTFEDTIAIATNIVKAEYVETKKYDTYRELCFKIQKQYKGTVDEEVIYIYSKNVNFYVADKGYSFNDAHEANDYVKGDSYILILERHVSVYYDHDRYLLLSGAYIPVEETMQSCMYGREPITEHSSLKAADIAKFGEVEKYIASVITDDDTQKQYVGVDFIKSSDAKEIIDYSKYVVRIKPVLKTEEFSTVCRYECEILREYKGALNREKICIDFPNDAICKDREYIVALVDSSLAGLYRFSSKNSLFDTKQEKIIIDILSEI